MICTSLIRTAGLATLLTIGAIASANATPSVDANDGRVQFEQQHDRTEARYTSARQDLKSQPVQVAELQNFGNGIWEGGF